MAMARSDDDVRPLSALPPRMARVVAFVAILVAGALGGALGYAITDAFCADECTVGKGLGLFSGSVITASGIAIMAVISLRAMGEWRDLRDRERAGHAP